MTSSLAKPQRYESEENLDLIRELPCTICLAHPVDPHHFKSKGSGGGDQLSNLISLCREHHVEVHAIGTKTFYQKHHERIQDFRIKFELPKLEAKWMLD